MSDTDDPRDTDVTERDVEGDLATALLGPADEPPRGRPLDVRAVLDEIGAEEAIAHLEARVAGLEGDLERAETRSHEAGRARQGELDVMRARVEDAMALVRDTLDEQRSAWSAFEERFSASVTETEESTRSFVSELREELTPRVQSALLRSESSAAEVRGEIAAVAGDLDGRATALGEGLAELRGTVERTSADVAGTLHRQDADRAAAEGALEERLRSRVDEVAAADIQRHEDALARVEALRRELDAAVGELRAGLNLRANELVDTLSDLHDELATSIAAREEAETALEQRWVEGTREIARRIEQNESVLRENIQTERAQRQQTADAMTHRVEELSGSLAEIGTRVDGELGRHGASLEQLKRQGDESHTRVDVLQGKVAEAVSHIASQLTNRVAMVVGDLGALRETTVAHQEKLAALDHLSRRVDELSRREPVAAAPVADEERLARMEQDLAGLRQHVTAIASTVTATAQQARDLSAALATVSGQTREQDGMRQEVRELAARTSEMTTRIDETEKLARAAGQAIATAVRRARGGARPPSGEADEQLGLTRMGDDQGR